LKISSRTVRANGIRHHYVTAGDGPPVVLLDGFPETSYAWRYQIPELAKKYHVIAPDLRGYGESDKPSSGYDKRTMAMDVRELMREFESAEDRASGA
jgi:haloacetate dehalogenase